MTSPIPDEVRLLYIDEPLNQIQVDAALASISVPGVVFRAFVGESRCSYHMSVQVQVLGAAELKTEPIQVVMTFPNPCSTAEVVAAAFDMLAMFALHEVREKFMVDGRHYLPPHPVEHVDVLEQTEEVMRRFWRYRRCP